VDPTLGVRRLVEVWSSLRLEEVLGFGLRQAMSLPRVVFGGGMGSGVFDVSPMARFVQREIPWRAISRALRQGRLQALSVSTTEVSTGRTVIFMQTGPGASLPTTAPPRTVIRPDRIGPHHALASAAIPLLFPPVPVGKELYVDGGLRQNTPIAPAIRLGSSHVFVVGTSRLVRGVPHFRPGKPEAPSLTFLLGKIMNALLLDHLDTDLGVVNLLNNLIESGELAFGEGFVDRLNLAAAQRGGHRFRRIRTYVVRPSQGLGQVAADYVRENRVQSGTPVTRRLLKLLDVGVSDDADLASYLLFDGGFARHLIELGRADAHAQRASILEFLEEADAAGPPGRSPPSGAPESGSSEWPILPPAVG
jgi:NTE family protein